MNPVNEIQILSFTTITWLSWQPARHFHEDPWNYPAEQKIFQACKNMLNSTIV